ncbi:MAG: hypothetical protein J6F31_05455 [Oscillospiraceae bacterium]|nr:hypothetical protein [Oscillospiraceae bacterium]
MELTPENIDRKFSRLDLKPDVDGRTVNIEMQVNRESDFRICSRNHKALCSSGDSVRTTPYFGYEKTYWQLTPASDDPYGTDS